MRTALRGQSPATLETSSEDRAAHDVRDRVAAIHQLLGRWTARDEVFQTDFFHARRMALLQLVEIVPFGAERDQFDVITCRQGERNSAGRRDGSGCADKAQRAAAGRGIGRFSL